MKSLEPSAVWGAAFVFAVALVAVAQGIARADCDSKVAPGSVFYVTDREPLDDDQLFSGERGLDANRKAIVSMGVLAPPPDKSNQTPCSSQAALFKAVQSQFDPKKPRQVLIYIHGYYTSFVQAVEDAMSVQKTLRFPGPVIVYSWPSKKTSQLAYMNDETNAGWSMIHFNNFLSALNKAFPRMPMSFAAHSLGSRFATDGISLLRHLGCGNCFGRAVLFAPDVDTGTLITELDSSDLCSGKPAERPIASAPVLLYVSNNDKALRQSQRVHGHQRAGQAGSELILCNGVDTVDVSYFSGSHGYMQDLPVLEDTAAAFAGVPPTSNKRQLKQVSRPGGVYYELRVEQPQQQQP